MTSTNDGKDVKSIQTSGPKGKSYYIELYKSLEARLTEGSDARERSKLLCAAWRCVHTLCQHSAPSTHTHLINWIQRHTARAVLETEWQKPDREDDRKSLEEAIDTFIGQVAQTGRDGGPLLWEAQLVARGEWFKRVLDKPWDHPVLTLLLNPNGTPPTDDEVLEWLKQERGVTFVMRLHTLAGEKCDDIAVSLASAVMDRARASLPPVADSEEQRVAPPDENAPPTFADKLKEEAGFTPDVWEALTDIEFVLLHKRDSKRCIALAKQTPLLEAYPLIERLQKRLEASPREKRLWKNAKEVAILIAQVVIARCMVVKKCMNAARVALYCCARLLARLLSSRLPAAADALAAQAPTARHLHTLAQAVDKQLSSTNENMKPYVCELYVRAITAGMNELERLKLKTEKEAEARSMEKTLASWFVQLGTVLARSDRIACECTLTAFSLHPSQKMFERIDAAPPLAPVITDANESKEETVKSEFGSWASDSRSQTNLVKTSETLNMKHTQNQANVLSTAIFNEGEALGLSPELCQDIAVLLAGPRVKTLSWDMDRKLLLENCRAYSEVTHEGTRVLTRELKYLNLDLKQYQHLPEEKDDDENDPYYGIERGYEHLAVFEEPQEIWQDAERTETASSMEEDYSLPRRKKKTKQLPLTSDEDSDPLSFVAETKRTQKKKERPHSKERSKGKKEQDLVDPLDVNTPSESEAQTKLKKELKEKKERKKKEKVPKVIGGKRSALAGLLGSKTWKPKKVLKHVTKTTTTVTDSVYDSQGKTPPWLNSKSIDKDDVLETITGAERKQNPNAHMGVTKNVSNMYNMMGNKSTLSKMQYKPQTCKAPRQQTPMNWNKYMPNMNINHSDGVKANLSKLLEFRRETKSQPRLAQHNNLPFSPPRQPAIIKPNVSLNSNISPKSVTIPDIPKSYINKEQTDKMMELLCAQNILDPKDSVIQYAQKRFDNKTTTVPRKTSANKTTASSSMESWAKASHLNMLKITDFVNPYERHVAEMLAQQSSSQEVIKPAHLQYPAVKSQRPLQRSYNVLMPGQRDFEKFVKEYDHNKLKTLIPDAIDMSSKSSREGKKPIMPVSRVTPVVPYLPKTKIKAQSSPYTPKLENNCQSSSYISSPENKSQPEHKGQISKEMVKKPDLSLNTFSRLSYHKNKQNEMKNKNQTTKPVCTTTTYQEVSSELDEIIKQHQQAQMKVIQAKRDSADKLTRQASVPGPAVKSDVTKHPLLSNLLQNTTSPYNTYCRNDAPLKCNVQQTSPVPQKTFLSEKDNNDVLKLLQQQDRLNNPMHYYSTSATSKPSTSVNKSLFESNYNTNSSQPKQETSKLPIPCTKSGASKLINILSDTLLKPGLHKISDSISISTDSAKTKPVEFTQNSVKKNVTSKNEMESKYIPESSKPEWQAVISDLLRHKTPTRGPNALDVALKKSSFETAFEKSVKEASSHMSQSQALVEKDVVPRKHHEKADHQKPVITSIQNVIITKKGIKLQNEVPKSQKDTSADLKTYLKQSVVAVSEKSKLNHTSEITKKLSQEVQRKHFTYSGPKNIDPFISGIPNSDYDLLEELMDDDLRKEIGELSSDDESYNTAAQSFLKPTNSSEKRVSVQFNKAVSEPTTKSASIVRCLNDRKSTNDILRSVTPKSELKCISELSQVPPESNSLKIKQKTEKEICHSTMPSTSQSVPIRISSPSNAQNQAFNRIKSLNTNHVMVESKTYISAVPQLAPVQNVVLLGQEVIYGGYPSIQTSVQHVHNLTPNAYVAVNSAPTMTLYQTTQFASPVVIGTSINVPVTNNVSCSGISASPNVNNVVVQSCYPAVTVEPQPSIEDVQISVLTTDTLTHIRKDDRLADYCQSDCKLQEETKANERKVLSEVQDFAMNENINKTQNHKIDNAIRKDTVTNAERLQVKRLAIINREIYHRCLERTIPLTYSPLPVKIKAVVEKQEFSEAIPISDDSASHKEDKQNLCDNEENKLIAQVKTNSQDLSNVINEVLSPATPDSNDSKENKSYPVVPCRRILLRSSNKIMTKPNADRMISEIPNLKKSKSKLKSEVSEVVTMVSENTKKDNTDEKVQKRASKRLRGKKIKESTDDRKGKKPLKEKLQKSIPKAKPSSTNDDIGKLLKTTESECVNYQDIESELLGTKIEKFVFGNNKESKQNSEKSRDCKESIVEPMNRENEVPEATISQTLNLEKSSEKSIIPALTSEDKRPEDSITQNAKLLSHSYQKAIDKRNNETEDVGVDKKCLSNHVGDYENDRNAITHNSADEINRDNFFNDLGKNTDENSYSIVNKDVNDICVKVSKLPCDELERNDVSKRESNAVASKEALLVSSTDLFITNDVKVAAEKCDVSDKTTCEVNKHYLPDKDNIDLDMSVTCEEVSKSKLSPTFGTIKTARNKPINTNESIDMSVICEVPKLGAKLNTNRRAGCKPINSNENKGENVKDCDSNSDYVISNEISVTKNKIEEKATDSNDIAISKKKQYLFETVGSQPTPKPLEMKSSKTVSKPASSNISHEMLSTARITADIDDDVIIIDDEPKTKPINRVGRRSEACAENSVNNNAPVLNFIENCFDDKTREQQHVKEVSPSNVLSQTVINTSVKPNFNTAEELSKSTENFKDNIRIENLPPIDSKTKRVRVCLPNGRRIIVSAGSEVCFTLDSLLSFPAIKQALLTEMDCKKRYIMYLQQTTTVDNSDRSKILSVQLNKIENVAPTVVSHKPVETVDLLSDDENNEKSQTVDLNKQVFTTEYGKFTALPMDKELFIKHQNKLSHKTQILLKKVDEKSDTPIIDKINTTLLAPKDKNTLSGIHERAKLISSKENVRNDTKPFVPNQYAVGLLTDIRNKCPSEISNKPLIIPEIVEIDDSSNDSLYQSKSAEGETDGKTINELKNELLKELGVETQGSAMTYDDDVEIVEETPPSKNNKRRKIQKLSFIPAGKSCPFNDLDEKVQLQITKRKCAIKLVRCDELLKTYKTDLADATSQLAQVFDDELFIMDENSTYNNLEEIILETEERSSSPVIELSDVLVSLDNKIPKQSKIAIYQITPSCEANWHKTKSMFHSERVDSAASVRCNVIVNDPCLNNQAISQPCSEKSKIMLHLQGIDEESLVRPHFAEYAKAIPVIDQIIPVSCEAIWRSTKRTLHLQSVDDASSIRSCDSEHDVEMHDDSLINKVISIACHSYWLQTKNMLHLQSIKSVREYDYEMSNDACHNQMIPLSCGADWLTTKSMLRLQRANDVTLEKCYSLDDDFEMRNNDLIFKTTVMPMPLSCDATWFMTKPTLRLEKFNDVTLIHSNVFESGKVCDNSTHDKEFHPPCDANWLMTKAALHFQTVKKSTPFYLLDLETELDDIHVQNVSPVTCEARWLTTKTTLHLEAARNIVLLPSNVLIVESESRCDRSSTFSDLNVTNNISFLTAPPPSAPSLSSLVLACFQNTSLIQQHSLLRNTSWRSHINLLKRKASSHRSSDVCKVSKLNKTSKIKSNSLSECEINTSLDLEDVSEHIIQDTKLALHLETTSGNKAPISSLCANRFHDNHDINACPEIEEPVPKDDACRIKDRVVLNNEIANIVGASHTLPEPSDVCRKDCKENFASLDKYRSSETDYVESAASLKKKGAEAAAVDRNTDIEIICESQESSASPDVLPSGESIESPKRRSPSPVIDIANFLSTLPFYNSCSDHANQVLSSNITAEQALYKNTRSHPSNSNSKRTDTYIPSKLEEIIVFDDNHIACKSIEAKKLADGNLGKNSLESELLVIGKSNCDDIEAKLAEIVGEPLLQANSMKSSQWDSKIKLPDCENSKMIELVLGDEPYINTYRNTVETGTCEEEINSVKNSDTQAGDHKYYLTLDEPLGSFDEVSNNEYEISYEEDMSENESNLELEEEIVHMRSDEIVDDFFFDATADVILDENSQSKICGDQVSGLINFENNGTTKDDDVIGQAISKKDEYICKEEKTCKEIENSIKNCHSATKDTIKIKEKTAELLNDVSTKSLMKKYRALARNKSQLLEVPENGIYYIIPIVEESQNDTKSNENEKATQMQSPKIKEKKANTKHMENVDNNRQSNTSHEREDNKNNGSNYDDIEKRLAEIVGESLAGNEKTRRHKTRFLEKYNTYNPKKGVEDFTCQLRKPGDQKASFKSLKGRTNYGTNKIRPSKYHDKLVVVNNLTVNKNIKVIKHTNSKDAEQIAHQKSSKRKIDTLPTKTSERKYRKNDTVTIGKNKIVSKHECCFSEKYKFSYNLKVEAIPKLEINSRDVTWHFEESIEQGSSKTEQSSGVTNIDDAVRNWPSRCNDTYKHKNFAENIENIELKQPTITYSKSTGQITTRQKTLKRKSDTSDAKISERKYRKGKNIDYPKFTAATLSESAYTKEFKSLMAYIGSVKFSFAVPFHKEYVDVNEKLKSWPIANYQPETVEKSVESFQCIFAEIEKSEALADPLELTLSAEINTNFDENSYTPSNINEINFNMGFGERSGRVIQESKDGEYTTFSAATLSDVKQLQPLLPSDEKVKLVKTNCANSKGHDQKLNMKRFVEHLKLRDKVRSFFEKTKAELASDSNFCCKKDDFGNNNDNSSWPFGDLTSTRRVRPSPVEMTVNVVQVGQLPVSAAAQNPVTCDPRVTHVSNASPSQCSPGNNLGDELQAPIKTEYTELTTADITLPLMQEYVQNHSMPSDSQQAPSLYSSNDNTSMTTQIKSIVKIELMEETSQGNEEDNLSYDKNGLQQVNGTLSNNMQYQFETVPRTVVKEADSIVLTDSSKTSKTKTFLEDKEANDKGEKPDQLAHAMNAAGISATRGIVKSNNLIDPSPPNSQPNLVTVPPTATNNFPKGTPINAIALQQAFAQILPSSLNQTNTSENNPQTSTNPQVLHIVQGNNAQSVINKPNGTQLLHIVQNKTVSNTNGTPAPQQTTFSGLSLVDGAIQQGANQLLHIVNTTTQKNNNASQLLKRVNLLTNLTNVQGPNEQKMVQFVCKSADGKSIQLPHQRSMVLRLQPLDPPNVPNTLKQNDSHDHSSSSGTIHSVNEKESNQQEMKSRSLYEENYAKFVQNDPKFVHNGDSKVGLEKATSLPKFNQVFGKQIYQDKQNEMDSDNLPENVDPPEENNSPLDQMNDITNPPMLIRKINPTQPSQVQPNLVQQIKQTIAPMNIQTMHGGVIYTRQIPVNIGNGQTINLITVPSTELVDESAQKQHQTDSSKLANQEGDPPIIKIVSTNQQCATPNGSTEENHTPLRPSNETNNQPNSQPQPVLTQMRIKLPMLSKAPQMVGGTRVVRPSFFQIQRNVIGGANQQVYQQLVLTAAPPLGPSIRLPAQVQKPKTPSEAQSSPESQMSSSTLEQLREFDMVLEQVKERSTVQPGSASTNTFTKLKSAPDTTDAPNSSASSQESPTQILYSVGNTQPLNMVNFVNRKSTITSTSTSSFVRSPDSTGTVESPSSSTQSHLVHTITSDSCASSSCASEAAVATAVQPKPKKKKPKPSTTTSNPFNIKNTPKPSSQKPLEDEQTTQRILYILAEYKEQVENSPDKDKPAPRRRNNPAAPNAGSSKRKKSSSGSRRRDMSPVLGEDSCRTMGSEDSSCGTSLGECNECLETHSPEESPKKVVRRLTFEQETQVTQTRTTTTTPPTTTTTVPQRNVIVTDGQAFAVRGPAGKPATTVLMPANYLLPVSMVKGGQQIAIVTNRGPKLLVGAGEGATGGTLLFQRLIGPGGLKPVLARPGVRHIRLPTAALHNLQAFNIAAPAPANVQPPDSTASPAPAPTPPDLVDTRAMSSPWPDRDAGEVKPERGNSSPEGSEPWNLPSSSIADDYGYEEIVRTDNMDRTVLDAIPDRYSPDLEAQRIFDKMFDSDSKKSMYDSRCGYDIDASDDDKAYHQVVHRKDGRHTRLTHVSAAALRHKYAILEHELRLQKSLSEECEDLGVDSPSASELFPEAELLFAPSPAHEQTIDQCHTPQPTAHAQGIPQPDLEDQIATDHLLTHKERRDELDINLDDVGEIVTVGEDGMTTIPLDHEEFARSHPNTTFHSEPEDGEVPPFTIAQGVKGRQITFHSRAVPGTVVMAPQTTVISQATVEASGTQNPVKFNDMDMINMPSAQPHINMPSVLKESNESLTKFDRLLNESREMNLSNTASAIVHSTGNGTQVIRRVQYEGRDSRYLVEDDAMIAGDSKTEERRDLIDDTSSSERHPELFWDTQSRPERKRFDFSSDSDKCCKSPYDEINSDSSGIGAHTRLDSVIKAARTERRPSDGSSAEESHPPLRTYPPKRAHQHAHHSHHDVDRSVTGKTRASDRCHDIKDESRRRASNRGVVKRGCHCCNGSTPPKPKKSRPKKSTDYPHN